MGSLNDRLNDLGQVVSDTSDRLAEPTTIATARRRWLESPQPVRHAPSRRRAMFALAAACALCAAILSFFVRRPAPLSFAVGSPPLRGTVGEWIAASSEAPRVVSFSEGTTLLLAPSSKCRVTDTTAHGAGVLLEQGSVDASVVHTGVNTRWALRAGPFDVRVTGTRFVASWDPGREVFEISMREGSVVVHGPLLSSERALVAGEHLRVSVRDRELAINTSWPEAPPLPSASARADLSATPQRAMPVEPLASGSVGAMATTQLPSRVSPAGSPVLTNDNAPSWRDLASAGKYKEAFEATERVGFAQEIERASSSDLSILADIARFAGRPALAREALLAQRRRFGVRGQSAFLIGKTAADQQGNSGEGVRWFEIYLNEEPGGALVEQALGRIMELTKQDSMAARSAAQRYIARYPNGSYSTLARSILSREIP